MDEVVEGVVGIMQQQVLLLHIAEDGFAFVQAGQLHGLGFLDGTYALVGIGQMPQILHVEVLVSRHQLPAVYAVGILPEVRGSPGAWRGRIQNGTRRLSCVSLPSYGYSPRYSPGSHHPNKYPHPGKS